MLKGNFLEKKLYTAFILINAMHLWLDYGWLSLKKIEPTTQICFHRAFD